MRATSIRWLAVVGLVATCSCRNLSYVSVEAVPVESEVTVGVTHYGEVLDRWGAPIFMAEVPLGFAFFYERIVIGEGSLGLKIMEAGYWGSSAGNRDYAACVLLFGKDDGVLADVFSNDTHLTTGSGVQLATDGQAGLVGTKDYSAGASPLGWGMRRLAPLPNLLNSKWGRIEIGEGGMELVDTPRDAGQHTLSRPQPWITKDPFIPKELK